jgi:hypothetical protein
MGVAVAGVRRDFEIDLCGRLRRFGKCCSALHRYASGNGCKQKVASIKHGLLPLFIRF